ncbi:hypothetical protein [Powai lake megavirus]|uniref:F-box and FNIP repeat-containing protein n=1 Tax=Powai lake megavirus TaxID=1842663 RepID=A0A160ER30_9VIRU|nr:hypothetical protein QJ849_gp967 [Powai lake megavirus]ANB51129.1 hypothetical protein [Powai lake megavirus]
MLTIDNLYMDIILHICKFLTSKDIIYFLSGNKFLNELKNYIYYDEICDYELIKNLEYYSRFRKIINVPNANNISKNVNFLCFNEEFTGSIKDKISKNIQHLGFPRNYDSDIYEYVPPNKINICCSEYIDVRIFPTWKVNYIVSNAFNHAAHFDSNLKNACDFIINDNDTISIFNGQNDIIALYDLCGNNIPINDSNILSTVANNKHTNQDNINYFFINKKSNDLFLGKKIINICTIGSRTFIICSQKDAENDKINIYIFDSEGNFVDEFCSYNNCPFGNLLSIISAPNKYVIKPCCCSLKKTYYIHSSCPKCSMMVPETLHIFPIGSYIISSCKNNGEARLNCFDYEGCYRGPLLNNAGLPMRLDGNLIPKLYYKNNMIEIFFLSITSEITLLGSLTIDQIIQF